MTLFYAQDRVDPLALSAQVRATMAGSPGLRWAVLVDSAFDHGRAPVPVPGGINCFDAAAPGDDEDLNQLVTVAPILYPIPDRDDGLRKVFEPIIEHSNGRPMWSLVVSHSSASEVARRWAHLWWADIGDGQRMLLRFADSRVLPTLPRLLGEQWGLLANGIDRWLHIERDGRLVELPCQPTASPGQPRRQARIRLTPETLDRFIRAAEADGHLADFAEDYDDFVDEPRLSALHARVEAACRLADDFAVDSHADRRTLAWLAIEDKKPLTENAGLMSLLRTKSWTRGQLAQRIDIDETATTE